MAQRLVKPVDRLEGFLQAGIIPAPFESLCKIVQNRNREMIDVRCKTSVFGDPRKGLREVQD